MPIKLTFVADAERRSGNIIAASMFMALADQTGLYPAEKKRLGGAVAIHSARSA